jgi:hypothetical protein
MKEKMMLKDDETMRKYPKRDIDSSMIAGMRCDASKERYLRVVRVELKVSCHDIHEEKGKKESTYDEVKKIKVKKKKRPK